VNRLKFFAQLGQAGVVRQRRTHAEFGDGQVAGQGGHGHGRRHGSRTSRLSSTTTSSGRRTPASPSIRRLRAPLIVKPWSYSSSRMRRISSTSWCW
jgi:hypothetical protein